MAKKTGSRHRPTLLQVAQTSRLPVPDDETLELAVAWFNGNIGMAAAGDALIKTKHIRERSNFYSFVSTTLRGALVTGRLKLQGPSSKG